MKHALLGGLSTLLLPFTAHAATTSAGGYLMRGGYQPRSYMRVDADAGSTASLATRPKVRRAPPASSMSRDIEQLDIFQQGAVTELVVVDSSVAERAELARGLRPGVAMVEIDAGRPGLPQLVEALRGYRGLKAIHVVSHAQAGALQLGSSLVDAEELHRDLGALAAVRDAVREGGDLLFYGCDLAADEKGRALLDIVHSGTGLDVAASDNLTGNDGLGGDWALEIKRGDIEAGLAFSARALRDFSGVLAASNGLKNFSGFTDNGTSLVDTDFDATARSGMGATLNIGKFVLDNSLAYAPSGWSDAGNYFYVKADGVNTTQFELTALTAGEAPGYSAYGIALTNVRVVGIRADGGTISAPAINGTAGVDDTFGFSLASFAGVKLKGFKLYFDCEGGCSAPVDEAAYMEFRNFTVVNATALPSVSDSRITISGATGTGSAYRIGDTVVATWNNTAGGDNNASVSGVTVDFTQFGGGAAVAATNSSGTWTASYTITAGVIDTAARNVSVTATSPGGSTTRADTTNATVDNIAPVVTDASISISGASGTGGAYRIGDTITATWNSTAAGDNNSDAISSATVNFSQFGGGAAVSATNSAGTWTATYTIVAGPVDTINRNVAVTATDNAGNATTAADTANATVDSTAPSVSSIAVSGSPASGDTSMAFTASFSEPVANVSTDDFALASTGSATGTISSVSAASGTSINVNITGITGSGTLKLNLNGSTDVSDDAGNTVSAYTSGSSHTVNIPTAPAAPTIGTATAGDSQVSVTFTAPGSNGGSAITTYTATASPGGAFGTCAGPAACTATVTGLANGTAYTFTVTATNAIGTSLASGASNSATPKGNQTITFANPGAQNFGTTPNLSATATSSLTPTFSSSTTGVCTITSGGALTFVTAGSCTIDADQAGSTAWNAATTVTQTFTVNAVVPGAPTIGTATAGDTQATVTFTAPASTGGAAIIASGYTVTASPGGANATGSSSPITVTGLTNGLAYTFSVTATNSAGEGAASAASNSVTPASPQAITFGNPGTQNFGTTPTLTATSDAGGGYPVSFTSATTGVCTVTAGGALTFVGVGSCTINANQAGDSSFLAAPQVSQTFTVAAVVPAAPTATTASAGDTQASIAFNAPVFIGGTAITGYTVTVSPADVAPVSGASSPIVVTGLTNGQPYTFTVTATNAAGTGPASPASNSIIPAATQTITFAAPGAQNFGTTPTFTATADSGLTPTFTSSTTGVCTITSGGALTFVTTGTCTINADQPGNGSYLAAPQVTRTFAVNAVVPGAPVIGTATVTGAGQASIAFTAPAFDGGASLTGYLVTASPGGATASGSASPIAISGLTPGTAYTFTVSATNAAGTGSPSAASNSITPVPALVAAAVSATVPYGAAATAVTLDIVGIPVTVAIASAPAHGVAVATGIGITYQPNPGYAGPDTFTYTASDAYSTSPAATVSITVPVPALVMDTATLPSASAGSAFAQTVSASGGAAPYGYAVTGGTLPAGLSLSMAGELAGTPTQAGTFSVTITATDSSTGAGPFTVSRTYALTVDAPLITVDLATLPAANGAQRYQQALIASGGVAPYSFGVLSGELPPGLALSASGEIAGEPTASGSYDFAVQVTDANGFTGSQAYTLAVQATAQVIDALLATPASPMFASGGTFTIAATGGASGNPVVFAATTPAVCRVSGTTVTMLSAGTCTLTADQAGDARYQAAPQVRLDVAIAAATPVLAWVGDLVKVQGEEAFDLPNPQSPSNGTFTFSSSNAAVATISGRTVTVVGEGSAVLTASQAASGSYTAASVDIELVVSARPDPTADRQVSGGLQAQVDASVRFAQVQQANIRDRLRQVRTGQNPSSVAVVLAYAGSDNVPGMSVPVGRAAEAAMPAMPHGWGVWAAGTATFGQVGRGGGSQGAFDFNTGGITLGADRAVGEHMLLGVAGSWGRQGTDFDDTPSEVDADQTSLAVYGLWRAGEHLFLDGMLATGRLDFELARWSEVAGATARADRSGDQWFGSLTFGYEHRNARGMTLTGYGRYDGHRSDLDAYREHGLGIFDLAYGDQRVDNSALAVGLEGNHAFQGDRTSWRPFWSVEYRKALENQGDASLNYVQRPLASDYTLAMRSYNDDMFTLGGGVELQLDSGWMFSLLLGHEQGRNQMRSNSIGLQVRFGAQSGPSPVYVDDDGLGYNDPAENGCGAHARGCRTRGIQP